MRLSATIVNYCFIILFVLNKSFITLINFKSSAKAVLCTYCNIFS